MVGGVEVRNRTRIRRVFADKSAKTRLIRVIRVLCGQVYFALIVELYSLAPAWSVFFSPSLPLLP
jgi:hypothetical protein